MELRDPWADNGQKPWWIADAPIDALDARWSAAAERADLW